jgi:hypothetical protein
LKKNTWGKMKTHASLLLFVVSLTLSLAAHARAAASSIDMTVPVNNVFIPGGFDSKTDAYVIVSGIFPNGCYKWKGATVKDVSALEHEITSVANVNQGMCIQVLIPFTKDIRLGQLAVGTHTLRFLSNDGTFLEKNLTIEQ